MAPSGSSILSTEQQIQSIWSLGGLNKTITEVTQKYGQRQADVRNLFCVVGRRGRNDVDDVDAQRCLSSTGQPFIDKVPHYRPWTDGCDFDAGAGCRVAGARWWAGS